MSERPSEDPITNFTSFERIQERLVEVFPDTVGPLLRSLDWNTDGSGVRTRINAELIIGNGTTLIRVNPFDNQRIHEGLSQTFPDHYIVITGIENHPRENILHVNFQLYEVNPNLVYPHVPRIPYNPSSESDPRVRFLREYQAEFPNEFPEPPRTDRRIFISSTPRGRNIFFDMWEEERLKKPGKYFSCIWCGGKIHYDNVKEKAEILEKASGLEAGILCCDCHAKVQTAEEVIGSEKFSIIPKTIVDKYLGGEEE